MSFLLRNQLVASFSFCKDRSFLLISHLPDFSNFRFFTHTCTVYQFIWLDPELHNSLTLSIPSILSHIYCTFLWQCISHLRSLVFVLSLLVSWESWDMNSTFSHVRPSSTQIHLCSKASSLITSLQWRPTTLLFSQSSH